jgi:segregation and condensation protein A
MSYRVKLELFEGPLDLLLHLVKKNEVDIADIPIATITDQYLAYLGVLEEMNLDIAGEFLVMAATLLQIKSRCLLPEPEVDLADDEQGDPRAELAERLREYQRFREAAFQFGQRPVLTRDVYARPRGVPPDELDHEAPSEIRDASLGALLDAFRQVLKRAASPPVHEVTAERLTVRDCIDAILERLRDTGRASFESLFPEGATRHRIIVTFLALLELMRLGGVRAHQETGFGELLIALATPSVQAAQALVRSFWDEPRITAGEG